jgi:hypothetical protein
VFRYVIVALHVRLTVRISLFDSSRDNEPKHKELTWQQFATTLGPHNFERSSKALLPAWSPAEYPEGDTRAADNVSFLHAIALDLDHVSEADALEACATFEREGLAGIVHTSWSHARDPWRIRLISPFKDPVPAEDWPEVWAWCNELFGGFGDPKCANPDRLYFGCFAPPGTEDHHFYHVFDGAPLDPGRRKPQAPLPPEGEVLSPERLAAFARVPRRKNDDYLSHAGHLIAQILKGKPFAKPGNRDNTLFRLACIIAKRFPSVTPESVSAIFAPSITEMGWDGDVAYKIRRQQEAIAEEERAKEEQIEHIKAARIREAFSNGRSAPYSDEELEAFGDPYWIVQHGRIYYLYLDGAYSGPYTDADILPATVRDLSPAPLELFHFRQGNFVRKPPRDLVIEYGTVAKQTVLDLTAQQTTYEPDTFTLIEAPCPQRPTIEPKNHPQIAKWLELMAGDKLEQLLAWLAAVTMLDRACVMLFLTGPPGTGKTLIALGLSRLWTLQGPTDLEDLLSPFNASLAGCPLVLADEQLPKDFRGYTKSGELRQAVQAVTRPYREKYRPTATIKGAVRIIVTANNEEILSTPENLSSHDLSAIVDRYLHVPTDGEAAAYLRDQDTSAWVDGDMIAEHVLWLVHNHKWIPKGRFLIEAQDEALHRSLTTRSGYRSALCQWLCSYLLNPSPFDNDARSARLVQVKEGSLFVNVMGIVQCWAMYVTNEPCPKTGALASALSSLSTEKRQRWKTRPGQPRMNYREINPDNLISWAEHTGFCEAEDLEQALSRDTDEHSLGLN